MNDDRAPRDLNGVCKRCGRSTGSFQGHTMRDCFDSVYAVLNPLKELTEKLKKRVTELEPKAGVPKPPGR